MHNTVLASLAYEVGERVGDTSTAFLTKIKTFLNDRYDDVLLRSCATMWTGASLSALGNSDVPLLGTGKIIKEGAISDAWAAKRQYQKSSVHEGKFNFYLANFIQSGDYQQFNISFSRYGYHV